jgi:hypothetical protein
VTSTTADPPPASHHYPILRVKSLELLGESLKGRILIACLVRRSWVAGAGRPQLGLRVTAVLLVLLLFSFYDLDFLCLVSACGRRKTTPHFGGDDAPSIVLVLLHGVAKLMDLYDPFGLAHPHLRLHDTTSCVSDRGSYHLVGPDGRLCLELRAVAHLQCTGAAAGEEVGDLLPGKVLLFLEVDEELIVFTGKLEFGTAWARRGRRHALLADDVGRAMSLDGGRWLAGCHLEALSRTLVGEMVVMLLRKCALRGRRLGGIRLKGISLGRTNLYVSWRLAIGVLLLHERIWKI